MGLRGIGYLYVFMIALIYVGLRRGSLPESFDMSFEVLFLYFFTLITVGTAIVTYVLWSAQRK